MLGGFAFSRQLRISVKGTPFTPFTLRLLQSRLTKQKHEEAMNLFFFVSSLLRVPNQAKSSCSRVQTDFRIAVPFTFIKARQRGCIRYHSPARENMRLDKIPRVWQQTCGIFIRLQEKPCGFKFKTWEWLVLWHVR
jgi:hypothetical protein